MHTRLGLLLFIGAVRNNTNGLLLTEVKVAAVVKASVVIVTATAAEAAGRNRGGHAARKGQVHGWG